MKQQQSLLLALSLMALLPVGAKAQNATIGDMFFEPDLGPVTIRYSNGKSTISGVGQMAVKEYKSDFELDDRYNVFSVKALSDYAFVPDSMTFTLRLDTDLSYFRLECLGWYESTDGPSVMSGNQSLDCKEILVKQESDPRVFGHYIFTQAENHPNFEIIFSSDQSTYVVEDFVIYGHTEEDLPATGPAEYRVEGNSVSAIEALRSEAAATQLYDLQGRKVTVPEAGRLYIRGRR